MKLTLEQIKTDESVWPEGATHFVGGCFTKWINNKEYSFKNGAWEKDSDSWKLQQYPDSTVIPRPTKTFVPEVGVECELELSSGKIIKIIPKYVSEHFIVFFDVEENKERCEYAYGKFHPIKSEREKFIETGIEINKSLGMGATEKSMFEALYDSGKFKLVEPTK